MADHGINGLSDGQLAWVMSYRQMVGRNAILRDTDAFARLKASLAQSPIDTDAMWKAMTELRNLADEFIRSSPAELGVDRFRQSANDNFNPSAAVQRPPRNSAMSAGELFTQYPTFEAASVVIMSATARLLEVRHESANGRDLGRYINSKHVMGYIRALVDEFRNMMKGPDPIEKVRGEIDFINARLSEQLLLLRGPVEMSEDVPVEKELGDRASEMGAIIEFTKKGLEARGLQSLVNGLCLVTDSFFRGLIRLNEAGKSKNDQVAADQERAFRMLLMEADIVVKAVNCFGWDGTITVRTDTENAQLEEKLGNLAADVFLGMQEGTSVRVTTRMERPPCDSVAEVGSCDPQYQAIGTCQGPTAPDLGFAACCEDTAGQMEGGAQYLVSSQIPERSFNAPLAEGEGVAITSTAAQAVFINPCTGSVH